jgi:large subunit ribosomal protein L17
MRHQKAGRKFGRNPSHRRAMFRNLAANLVLHERIETTDTKAKELKRIADRLLTRALRLGANLTADLSKFKDDERTKAEGSRVHAERLIARYLPRRCTRTLPGGDAEEVDLVQKLFEELAPRYLSRVQEGKGGGYTRIIRKSWRRGDGAPMVFIEFLPAAE